MTDTIVTAIVGGLVLLMFGWTKHELNRLADKIDRLEERVDALFEAVARIEDRLEKLERR